MTKKAKSSKKIFVPALFELPFMHIAYGLFSCRAELDAVLTANDIPVYKFDTDGITYAATMRGAYEASDGLARRYAFIYAEDMLNDDNTDDARKLSYLAHEAHHVVQFMFECMGETQPSEEAFAYTLGNVCNNLFNEYFRWKEFTNG
jgi:hypothetical protein